MNPNFCLHPWQGLDISSQNQYKPCCKYQKSLGNSIDEYLQNQELKDLRNNFLQGKKDPNCSRCWQDESAGLPSKRQLDFEYVFKNKIDFNNETNIKVLNIGLGNTCNLSCRTCNSYSSSKWSVDEIKLNKIDTKFVQQIFPHNNFYKDEKFFDDLFNKTGDLIAVDINGGEPFYSDPDSHFNFLFKLKNKQHIKLKYITNATVRPSKKLLSLWNEFDKIEIMVSIDGVGVHNNYIRHPSNWDTVYENVKFYQTLTNIQLSISHTLSVLNILYLPEFLLWCDQEKLPKPYIGLVTRPTYYDIKILPDYIKQTVIDKFKNFNTLTDLKSVKQHLEKSPTSMEWPRFLSITENLDNIRNQKIVDFLPEFFKLIK